MGVMEGTQGLKEASGEYDFAVDGGAISTIVLRGGPAGNDIPAGSIIMGGYIEVDTGVTSGGAPTVSIQAEAANDIANALAPAGLTVGRKSVIPVFTGATTVKTTVRRSIAIVIATATLTAGKFRVVLFYR